MNLKDPYINFIIISSYLTENDDLENRINASELEDEIINRDFTFFKMSGSQPSLLAYKDCDNNELRYDAIELMDKFRQNFVIIKYKEENTAKKILHDGRENLLGIVNYTGDENNHNFFVEGTPFSFEPQKRYRKPKRIEDFKPGMTIEFLNNEKQWVKKKVKDPEVEYKRMYKLLIKYDKIRIEYDESHIKKN